MSTLSIHVYGGPGRMRDRTKEDATLAGRIRIGMAGAGISSPAALARRMKVNRQTVHRWITGEGDKLTPEMLFRLADALEVNPQWLALGAPHSPVKPHIPSVEEAELISLFASLPSAARESWMSSGRDLIKLLTPTSIGNPFAKTRK